MTLMHIRAKFDSATTLCGQPTGSSAWKMSHTSDQYIACATRTVRDNTCEACKDALVRQKGTP